LLRGQLEAIGLICPVCRAQGRGELPLRLGVTVRADGDDILEGALVCDDTQCRREHPIIDGIPVVVSNLGGWAQHQLDAVLRREDLSPWMTSLLGDAAGAGTVLDNERRNLSTYATAHWASDDSAGGFPALLGEAFALAAPPAGVCLDLGASVGRGTFALAAAGATHAIGVDLSFAMLKLPERARRTGRVTFEQRQHGVVYEGRELAAPAAARVGFVCADVMNLPFATGTAGYALDINVVDCIAEPLVHLSEVARVIAAGASAIVASPYDWQPNATPLGNWLGGHSQRGELRGSPEATIRALLAGGAADAHLGLQLVGERERVPWRLYVNARSTMEYAVHVMHLRRV
jgi:SAM-dependent methyltransferase